MKINSLLLPLVACSDCPDDIGDFPSGIHDGWGHWYHLVDNNFGVGTPIPVT